MSTIYVIERQYDYDTEPTIDTDLGYFATREAAKAFIEAERVETEAYNKRAESDPDYLQDVAQYRRDAEMIRQLGGRIDRQPPVPSRRHVDYFIEVIEIKGRA